MDYIEGLKYKALESLVKNKIDSFSLNILYIVVSVLQKIIIFELSLFHLHIETPKESFMCSSFTGLNLREYGVLFGSYNPFSALPYKDHSFISKSLDSQEDSKSSNRINLIDGNFKHKK